MANIPIYGKLVNETVENIIADASQVAMPGGGTVDSELAKKVEIFVAEYGVTSLAAIEAAVTAGKLCFCDYTYTDLSTSYTKRLPLVYLSAGDSATFALLDAQGFSTGGGRLRGYAVSCAHTGGAGSTAFEWRPLYHDPINPNRVTVTLAANAWSNNAQTKVVTGVLADETAQLIQPVPASSSREAYENAGVRATAQAAGSLTFTCDTIPASDLSVYVVITTLKGGIS